MVKQDKLRLSGVHLANAPLAREPKISQDGEDREDFYKSFKKMTILCKIL